MKETNWQCACCVGKGSVPMPQVYRETLSMIESAGSPFTLLDLPTGPAPMMNNRLCELERRGYIERRGKRGKFVIWHAIEMKKDKEFKLSQERCLKLANLEGDSCVECR